MQVTAVSCNQCGGSLEIPDSARFATCRYCGANLEIKRNESAVFTQVLEQINQRENQMESGLHRSQAK